MYLPFRSLLAAAFLGFSTFSACQKVSVEPANQAETALVGRWALVQTVGGIGGGTRPADPQRFQEIEFMADGQARTMLNNVPTAIGTYTLNQATSYLTRQSETFVSFNELQLGGHPFIDELSATTLVLNDDHADGIGNVYRREQPIFCGTR